MGRVPIIQVDDALIAAVQEDLRDRDALDLEADLGAALERTGARGVLLDVSIVETIDTFLGRLLNEIAAYARLLGAHTVVAGIQPAVAVTLVELGLELRGVHTALNAEKGLTLLRRLIRTDGQPSQKEAQQLGRQSRRHNGQQYGQQRRLDR
jgi:rsbT antagonist protein RsbS